MCFAHGGGCCCKQNSLSQGGGNSAGMMLSREVLKSCGSREGEEQAGWRFPVQAWVWGGFQWSVLRWVSQHCYCFSDFSVSWCVGCRKLRTLLQHIRTGFVLSALCWHGTFPSCMIPFFAVVFGWLVGFLWVGYSLDYSHLCQLSCSFSPVPDRHICVQAIPLDKMIHSNHCVGQKCEAGQCCGVWPKGFRTAGDLLLLQVL